MSLDRYENALFGTSESIITFPVSVTCPLILYLSGAGGGVGAGVGVVAPPSSFVLPPPPPPQAVTKIMEKIKNKILFGNIKLSGYSFYFLKHSSNLINSPVKFFLCNR